MRKCAITVRAFPRLDLSDAKQIPSIVAKIIMSAYVNHFTQKQAPVLLFSILPLLFSVPLFFILHLILKIKHTRGGQ